MTYYVTIRVEPMTVSREDYPMQHHREVEAESQTSAIRKAGMTVIRALEEEHKVANTKTE